ncbi:MAG: response regulator [Anaerolineales bacterium]|nr:response regulator [Anaerolineales bacterium]
MATTLIIDDDADFVRATQMVLEKEGYQVESASGGKEGYQKARELIPDLVILDVMMDSVLDGVSVSRKLHSDSLTSEIPIIMVTSIANTDYAELFPTDEYIHIDAFFSKPIDPEKLIKKIRRILS